MQNGAGTMELNKVNVSGFTMGVHASKGKVDINGKSTIEVIAGGTGLWVGGTGNASMMGGSIKGGGGSGAGNYGVQGSGTVILNMVDVSGFGKGVEATGGKLVMMGGTVTFEDGRGNFGVHVQNGATADLTKVTIMGKGGQGTGVVMGSSETMTMNMVTIEGVGKGVEVKNGTVNMMGGTVTFTGGNGNWGVKVESGAVANIMGATIKGSGSGKGTGLYVEGGTLKMTGGEIKEVESGVYATGTGNLTINGEAKITFKGGAGNYGVKVMGAANANITGATITGGGATGTGVIKDGT
ncbi:hypothetical protein, partial [Bartonella bovis]|uniref:hypothetical protein n=1 Tax=Bartonella bovis TaxID=155194 RepID=UPI0011AFC01B